jgi:hypothetical protein
LKKEDKKKLVVKRLTICNLTLKKVEVLVKDEQKVIKAGDDNTSTLGVGVTSHPKYC